LTAPSRPFEEDTLARRWSPEAAPLEWAGIFLFAVGVFGATKRGVTRHMLLGGVLPLDWFYVGLLVLGAALFLASSPASPFQPVASETPAAIAWRWFRAGVCLALLAAMVFLALRP
jgi:hypothetical protein